MLLVAASVTAFALVGAPRTGATSVAYIDGNEVWLSSLDGKRNVRLSSGEGDWRAVAAADSGRVLGIRLESGKIFQLSRTELWNASGRSISQGPLPSETAGWSSYVAPVGLDLSADGIFLAYGYSGYTGIVPNASFFSGHYVVNADTKTLIQPIGQTGYEWPSMFGRRVVAASGSTVAIQVAGSGPFGQVFALLVDTAGTGLDLQRTDIAANGRLLAVELSGPSADRVAVISISGVDPPVTVGAGVDCFLPASGDADSVSFSQDGSRIAWHDDRGVMVAGVPKTLDDPCRFSSPAVRISRTGSSPSIGGIDLPRAAPPTGFRATVKVPMAGRYRVTGTVPAARLGLRGRPRVCVAGSARASRPGPVRVNLRSLPACRRYAKRLKGASVRLKLVKGSKSFIRSARLS